MNKRTRICPGALEGICDGKATEGEICGHALPHRTITYGNYGKCCVDCTRTKPPSPPCLIVSKKMVKPYLFRMALNGVDISGWQQDD